MRVRLSAPSFSLLVFLAATLTPNTFAQEADIFVTPVPNVPFHAFVEVDRSITHNGAVSEYKSYREIGRDSQGRIHNESRSMVKTSEHKDARLLRVHLYDPQTRMSAWYNPDEQVFWTATVNHPPSTEPPQIRFEGSNGSAPANDFTKEEDLGTREIEGVPAHGVRETQVVPLNGGKEVTITDEYWYSPDLRINLIVKHDDPRSASITLTVSQVERTEPDAAFFEVPEGYIRRGMRH